MARFRYMIVPVLVFVTSLNAGLAASELRNNTALRWVPDSVAFYASMMRMQQQWEIFAQSNAYASLKRIPLIQMGVGQIKQQWNSPEGEMADVRAFLEKPKNAGLIKLAQELFATEFFVCGDQAVGSLIYDLNKANQSGSLDQLRKLAGDGDDGPDQVTLVIEAIRKADVPNLVAGFRIDDVDNAIVQLGRLEKLVNYKLKDKPELLERVQRIESESGDFLQFSLDAEMIPWDKAMKSDDLDADQVEQLREALEGKELFVSAGVVEGYVYLGMTSGSDPIAMFRDESLLIDSKSFEKVREFEDREITSVGYVSGDFLNAVSRPKEDMRQFGEMAKAVLSQTDLDKQLVSSLKSDIDELVDDVVKFIPEQGTAVGFEYLTDTGYEGYQQSWAENKFLDASKPLDILQHVGQPLMVIAARQVMPEDAGQLTAKWVGRTWYYVEQIASQSGEVDEAQMQLMQAFTKGLAPFAERWMEITETHMKKATADGESGFVIDSKMPPKEQWHPLMPPAQEPLALLEFASLTHVTDADQLEAAMTGYDEVAHGAVDELKTLFKDHAAELAEQLDGQAEMLPQMVATLELPTPVRTDVTDGRIYRLTGLQDMGVDAGVAPCLGWSSDMMVASLTPATVERFLGHQKVGACFADQADKPLATAFHLDFAGMIDHVKPWLDYGIQRAAEQQGNQMILMFTPQIDSLIEVMACFKSYTSVTYAEGDSLVTFYRQEFGDLED
ncbi:MAG: hypothetical protein AAGF97_01380 [Planctomycetota bacterium]